MSDIQAVGSGQPSLIEELMNSTAQDACLDCVQSSSSMDELQDKLDILEKAAGNNNPNLVNSINNIQSMIENGTTLDEIKNKTLT